MIRFLSNCLLTLWLSFLTGAVVLSHMPVDLSHIQGLNPPTTKEPRGDDVLERMEQAVWRRQEVLEISEADINRYLAATLASKQEGPTKGTVKFDRVAVDLEPDLCRVWFVWNTAGHQSAAALDLTIRREQKAFITEVKGGRYGRLHVMGRGVLATLVPACSSLSKALDDELHTLFQMNQIRFMKDKMVLDPQFENDKESPPRP